MSWYDPTLQDWCVQNHFLRSLWRLYAAFWNVFKRNVSFSISNTGEVSSVWQAKDLSRYYKVLLNTSVTLVAYSPNVGGNGKGQRTNTAKAIASQSASTTLAVDFFWVYPTYWDYRKCPSACKTQSCYFLWEFCAPINMDFLWMFSAEGEMLCCASKKHSTEFTAQGMGRWVGFKPLWGPF